MFLKLFQSGLWTYIWSKMSKMGSICSKWANFGENGQNWVILANFWGPKSRHMPKFWEIGYVIVSLKVPIKYFTQFYV